MVGNLLCKAPKKAAAKSPFPATKGGVKKAAKNPLSEKRTRNFGIGQDVQPVRNLSRYVRWPQYVQLQRQKKILNQRLKVPPALAQFQYTLDKNTATSLFKLLNSHKPETKVEKKERLTKVAAATAEGKEAEQTAKPTTVKFGLNHVVGLVENKKASLVIIAHDVDPIELVVYLPALCRKMGVPYCIVKGKARLGSVVGLKTASALALTEVKSDAKSDLANVISAINANFTEKFDTQRKQWGGGIMGQKSQNETLRRKRISDAAVKV